MKKKLNRLLKLLEKESNVFIQTHNFPDHDAVASAYALQVWLKNFDIPAQLVYHGEITRSSLHRMIRALNIDICHISACPMNEKNKVIIVDGCKGNKNVTDLVGDEVAVIDHHDVSVPDDVAFSDIRSQYGACATIIFSYFQEAGVEIPRDAATALMLGITMDTMHLTRTVNAPDLEAYVALHPLADVELVNAIARNDVNYSDLAYYEYAIKNLIVEDRLGFVYFPDGCGKNLLGILSDFILALDEVDFAVLCARNGGMINFSLRSENPLWDAAAVIHSVLEGVGFGGGHSDMAGGIITDASRFDREKICNLIKARLNRQ
jgi:nanoRNase/pAp phosphatase (c-di-AMP/oligoRNAs hydrolase)